MSSTTTEPRIFFSVAEASADLYAANLARSLRRRIPTARFFGLTGPLLHNAGCETFHDLSAKSAMLLATLKRIPEGLLLLHRLKREFHREAPNAAVLIDSPVVNLRIAKLCKSLQIPVLYYVAPQTWAWAAGRVQKMRKWIDRLEVILPFEERYFQSRGLNARFVGHPLFEERERSAPDEHRIADLRMRGQPVIALLPGARRQVIHEVFPGQLEIAARIQARFPKSFFLVVGAHAAAEDTARAIAASLSRSGLKLSLDRILFDSDHRDEMLLASDLALVASGTATLDVAYRATPMIVMYNHGRMIYPIAKAAFKLLGREFLTTNFLSLPNIIAGREIVPEFMPLYRSIDPIAETAIDMLSNPDKRDQQSRTLAETVSPLIRNDVSDAVASDLIELMRGRTVPEQCTTIMGPT